MNSVAIEMAAALQIVWPDMEGQHFLDSTALRVAIYQRVGFSEREILQHDAKAHRIEQERRANDKN